jgi:hypothetical protein
MQEAVMVLSELRQIRNARQFTAGLLQYAARK